MFRYYISVFCLLISTLATGQLVTNNSKTAVTLVKDVLAGEGVEISNVTYTGNMKAIGEFFGSSSNIGLNHGIIMSTGTVLNEVNNAGFQKGPVGPNNNPNAKTDFGGLGDADIENLVGKQTHDAAVLQFDFIPDGDTVKFRYVFASEEYPSQVMSGANDFFAFFISGSGISGTENIALLPNTNTVVSIETVNAGVNASYYMPNGNGLSGAEYSDVFSVNYNAFTTVLTAISKVEPCQTYHLKIVIADVLDGIFDSGVFLEANSLNSVPAFEINQQANFTPTSNNEDLFENCSHNGELKVTRESKLDQTLSVDYSLSGTAINGLDYDLLGTNITFGVGETEKIIEIKPITDALMEGNETVVVKFDNPDQCDLIVDSLSFTYKIKDRPTMDFVSDTNDAICANEEVIISVSVSGGLPDYTYKWLTAGGETTEVITVTPSATTKYLCETTDLCGQTITGDVIVNVPVYTPLVVIPMNDTVIKCRGAEVTFIAGVTGGAGEYEFRWSSGQTSNRVTNTVLDNVTYVVDISDKCKEMVSDDVFVELDYPVFSVSVDDNVVACYGDTVSLSGSATGGVPPYSYSWESGIPNPYLHVVLQTKPLVFSASDSCGIIPAADTLIVESQQPISSFAISSSVPEPNESIKFLNNSKEASSYYWDFGNGLNSVEKQPYSSYEEVSTYAITLIAIDDLSCSDTVTHNLVLRHPFYFYLPSSFSPDGNGLNDLFVGKSIGVTDFSMIIFDRSGLVVYSSANVNDGWDGKSQKGKEVPTGVYVVKIHAKSSLRLDTEYKFSGTVTLIR